MTTPVSGALSPMAGRVFGLATIAAPLLLLGSTVAYTQENGINDGVVGGTIGVWSTITLAIAFVGIYRLIEPQAPRIGPIFGVIALTGFVAGTAFNVQAMYLAAYGQDLLADVAEGTRSDVSTLSAFAFLPWGWFAPLSFVATGILLWRTRTAPVWAAGLLTLGGVLFIASRPARINVLAVICDLVLVLALVPIGWAMLRKRAVVADVMATTSSPVG